ncbi:AAA family ATPase [Ensifer adhaerens]|uniref:AAA family ATPase n=1 Tax=Ensifer adhaerens TaxID=106592 RepID=UPI00384BAA88
MKKLFASRGRDEEFRAVAEQIIDEEEKKNNRVLARSLRRSLETVQPARPKALAPLIPFPEAAGDFIERIEPTHNRQDIVLSTENVRIFQGLLHEFQSAETIRRRGLSVRSKLLFCGPPGCGKTLCAEVFASELGLPLYIVKLDRLISSYLGETATNVRKLFEFARTQPCVLFFDEFDALARARGEDGEHNELRRVVNSLLIFIDRIQPRGFVVAATNLDQSLDPAIWRRFDEVVWFDRPDKGMIARFLKMRFKNVAVDFDPQAHIAALEGYTYAELERLCLQAIKAAIIDKRKTVLEGDFVEAIADERRRQRRTSRIATA